jgi:hypothetical protein
MHAFIGERLALVPLAWRAPVSSDDGKERFIGIAGHRGSGVEACTGLEHGWRRRDSVRAAEDPKNEQPRDGGEERDRDDDDATETASDAGSSGTWTVFIDE